MPWSAQWASTVSMYSTNAGIAVDLRVPPQGDRSALVAFKPEGAALTKKVTDDTLAATAALSQYMPGSSRVQSRLPLVFMKDSTPLLMGTSLLLTTTLSESPLAPML